MIRMNRRAIAIRPTGGPLRIGCAGETCDRPNRLHRSCSRMLRKRSGDRIDGVVSLIKGSRPRVKLSLHDPFGWAGVCGGFAKKLEFAGRSPSRGRGLEADRAGRSVCRSKPPVPSKFTAALRHHERPRLGRGPRGPPRDRSRRMNPSKFTAALAIAGSAGWEGGAHSTIGFPIEPARIRRSSRHAAIARSAVGKRTAHSTLGFPIEDPPGSAKFAATLAIAGSAVGQERAFHHTGSRSKSTRYRRSSPPRSPSRGARR